MTCPTAAWRSRWPSAAWPAQARCTVTLPGDPFTSLFSESAARAVVAVRPAAVAGWAELCAAHGVPAAVIGETSGPGLAVAGLFSISLEELAAAHGTTLPAIFG